MKARGWYRLLIAVAVTSRVFALELQNLPGADFKPGQLRLPLTVHERSGVERKGAVVTSGVPFPVGFLHDVKRLCVLDTASNAVPCQAIRMVKWHKPTYDDSVQWALVSFRCNVPANGMATYYLTDAGQTASPTKLKVEKRESGISVDTGVAVFVVPLQGQSLLRKATVGGKDLLAGEGLRSVITSGDWPERGLKQGDVHIGTIESVTVEEEGPVRVVIAIKGRHTPGDKDGKFYGFTTRLYFEADSPSLRVIHSLTNCKLDPQLYDGWRYVYTWPIEDASLVADLALRDGVKITTTAEGQPLTRSQGLRVYHDSSGGDKWQNLGGGNYEGWISRYTGGLTVRGVTFRGYKVYEKESEIAAGNSHPGVLDVSDGVRGLTVALRNFRTEYPHAVAGEPGRLRIGLFPGEFSEPFHLNAGQRKSWDLRLFTHGAELPDLQECFAVQDTLLLFRPLPAWMVRAGAEGAWPYGIALVPDQGRKPRKQRLDKEKLDGIHVGWDWYGWISGYNSGGGHWNEETVSLPWVLWGDGENFDDVERKTLWSADLTALHWDEPDISTFWLMLMSWNDHENRLKRVAYPGWYNRDTWGLPDSGHMGMLMWPEYYFLTGDMRAREAIEHLGIRARAFLWRYNHDDKNDGTGPLPRAINWCRKRDPDTEPNFRLATRYVGWPLFDLANYYRFSGDPQLLAECRTVARAFRNTARYSPIGFMVLQINAKGSKDVYGGQGPFEKYRDLSASQCYAHFQQGLMCTGLIEYYLMSGDSEALDALIGFADLMCHHCMLRDPEGKRRGWTYAFGDYWGPYTWEDCGGKGATFHVSNYTVTEALGWTAQFTGRQDIREVLADALAAPGAGLSAEAAAFQAVHHPKADSIPPAAIGDLKVEVLGEGKIRLLWTAPGDDGREGQAAWYQIKFSTAQIMERVQGWPDRSEPLPADAKEWETKASAFNARQRAFWAANTVLPPPRANKAGTRETMLVENLAPGTYSFAVKTWDEADNVSEISNIVRIEVR